MTDANTKTTILMIDDDKNLCHFFREEFASDTINVLVAHTGKDGLEICSGNKIDILFLDQKLPDMAGLELCQPVLNTNDQTKIIFITAFPNFQNALSAIKTGAYDYISKPFDLDELHLTIDRLLRTIELEKIDRFHSYRYKKEQAETGMIGKSTAYQKIRQLTAAAASSRAPVLITGETGTGKNLVAKIIHLQGEHPKHPFVSVNCASLPDNLVEAELFGYEKGAFTGAVAAHKGVFEIAEGGTLLLDEIGAMPVHLQSKLLGVLDEKKFRRLGGKTDRTINVRIIAATNAVLETMTREKTFREDLYFRLNVLTIHIPPLRERMEDLPELCRFFIDHLTQGEKKPECPGTEIEKLKSYHWPGNIRELRNLMERSIILHGGVLRPSEFIRAGSAPQTLNSATLNGQLSSTGKSFESGTIRTLEEIEKEYMLKVFEHCDGNYSLSARMLGISLSTFRRKMAHCQKQVKS